jgi:transcriptional regulator of aromatic amino acid metabolism
LPVVHFVPDKVVVMTSVYLSGIEFVATVDIKPGINEEGKLTVVLDSVKVGAVPVTIAARVVAKKMYNEQISGLPKDDIRVRIAGAMFEDQPFEPVMEVDGKTVKIGKIKIEQGVVLLGFVPVKQR